MPALIIAIISFITSDLIKKLLLGAGIGIVAGTVFKFALNIFVDKLIHSFGGLPAGVLQLMGLLGIDKALSIIIGALAMRAAIQAMQLSFSKT